MRKEDPGQKFDAEQGQSERRFPFLDATYLHTGQTRFSRARKRAGKIPGRKNRKEKDKKPARESGEEKRADFPLNAGCREILLGSLRSFSSLSLHLSISLSPIFLASRLNSSPSFSLAGTLSVWFASSHHLATS